MLTTFEDDGHGTPCFDDAFIAQLYCFLCQFVQILPNVVLPVHHLVRVLRRPLVLPPRSDQERRRRRRRRSRGRDPVRVVGREAAQGAQGLQNSLY